MTIETELPIVLGSFKRPGPGQYLDQDTGGSYDFVRWFGICQECLTLHTKWQGHTRNIKTGAITVHGSEYKFSVTGCMLANRTVEPLGPRQTCRGKIQRLGTVNFQRLLTAAYSMGGPDAVTDIVVRESWAAGMLSGGNEVRTLEQRVQLLAFLSEIDHG